MNKNVNSDDEEIAILEDDDPGLDSTDNENEGKSFRIKKHKNKINLRRQILWNRGRSSSYRW